MKTTLLSSTALLAILAFDVRADTVKTQDGRVYEGTITSETADTVTIEYKDPEAKGVTDTKTLKKAEVTLRKQART